MNELIDKIQSPEDVKKLSYDELKTLAGEIREKLIHTVSKTGGHLASNLGVVELTLALHREFDCPKDKIIWDVGHQSYVHKMLTGRLDKLDTLRQKNGISGFPRPTESEYDSFHTGHSSTSLSVALGMAKARDLSGDEYHVVAVIGDGSLTGGLALEAINNISHMNTRLIIVINDNEMSISGNVGAFSKYLARIRIANFYTKSKSKIKSTLLKIPAVGDNIVDFLARSRDSIKMLTNTPGIIFEEWGLEYLGPVDGHDIRALERVFEHAKTMDKPVVVHIITQKGKGYSPAEEKPDKFHGVPRFEIETGEIRYPNRTYSDVFGGKLLEIAKKENKVVAITPAMTLGSGLSRFAEEFPERFFDVGIAEAHAVTFAAGLASAGLVPVACVYSSFLQRAYDSVLHDIAIGNYHVVLAVDRAGLVPGDGETHQGVFDISYLSHIPNISILSPACYSELEVMLEYAILKHNGPIAVRYPRGCEHKSINASDFEFGKAKILRAGYDVTIVAEGEMVSSAVDAADILAEKGITCEIIDIRTIKPMDMDTIIKSIEKTRALVTLENNVIRGGMGEMLVSGLAGIGKIPEKLLMKGVKEEFPPPASVDELMEQYGLDSRSIAEDILKL